MNCFIVVSPDQTKVRAAVKKHFPEHHYEVTPGVWAVAGSNKVPSDICEALGIVDGGVAGATFALTEYNGFFHSALWEKLNLWEKL